MSNWVPTEQEIEEKLIEMAYVWGDIEERIEPEVNDDIPITDEEVLAWDVARSFRVEARFLENDFGDPCPSYVLLFDVTDRSARNAMRGLEKPGPRTRLSELIRERARPWHSRDFLMTKLVARSSPVDGQICRRRGEEHPAQVQPTLDDVPTYGVRPGSVELIDRDAYLLTPIEAPFYDALRETGLTFAVQPWIQGTDKRYRLDFLVFYDGGAIAVELDGHEFHKTKEQRSYDAERDRWFAQRKIQTIRFTGSQVFRDAQGCVSELLNIVRASQARP